MRHRTNSLFSVARRRRSCVARVRRTRVVHTAGDNILTTRLRTRAIFVVKFPGERDNKILRYRLCAHPPPPPRSLILRKRPGNGLRTGELPRCFSRKKQTVYKIKISKNKSERFVSSRTVKDIYVYRG